MEVQAWSPNLTKERCDAEGIKFIAGKEELFETSDVISIHLVLASCTSLSIHVVLFAPLIETSCPLATAGIVDYSTLSLMKPTAFLINTSRGPLIKEADLVRAIKEGKIAGVGLDVFDIEPLPLNHELRELAKDRKVTLSPHIGYVDEKLYSVGYLLAQRRDPSVLNLFILFTVFGSYSGTIRLVTSMLTSTGTRRS